MWWSLHSCQLFFQTLPSFWKLLVSPRAFNGPTALYTDCTMTSYMLWLVPRVHDLKTTCHRSPRRYHSLKRPTQVESMCHAASTKTGFRSRLVHACFPRSGHVAKQDRTNLPEHVSAFLEGERDAWMPTYPADEKSRTLTVRFDRGRPLLKGSKIL